MKFYGLLLGLLVLFLSVKSVVEPIASLAKVDACCKEKTDHGTTEDNEDDHGSCNDHCSPFQPCCPYIAFTAAPAKLEQPKPLALVGEDLPLYSISFFSNYASDFWQPPKLV